MRKNIRQIKRELRNFAKSARRPVRARHFARRWEDDGEEGETLQDKCEIINRLLFDGEEKYYLNPEKLLDLLVVLSDEWNVYAVLNASDACEHLIDVLKYLIGKDRKAKRPKSLAVYDAAEKLSENTNALLTLGLVEPFDYEENALGYLEDYMEEYFEEKATDAFKAAILNGETITAKNIEEYDDSFWGHLTDYISWLPGEVEAYERTAGNHEAEAIARELHPYVFEDIWLNDFPEDIRGTDAADEPKTVDADFIQESVREYYMDKHLGDVIKELSKNGEYKDKWKKEIKSTENKLFNKIELAYKSLPSSVASHYGKYKIVVDTKFFTGDLELPFKKKIPHETCQLDVNVISDALTKQGLIIQKAKYMDNKKGVYVTVELDKNKD